MFLLTGHYDFTQRAAQNLMQHDIVYVPINWSLQFYAVRYAKSHMTPDIVYVPTKWSLSFYAARCTKSHAILTHIAYIF